MSNAYNINFLQELEANSGIVNGPQACKFQFLGLEYQRIYYYLLPLADWNLTTRFRMLAWSRMNPTVDSENYYIS